MSLRSLAAAGTLAAVAIVPLAATPALAVCDAYSGACVTTPPTSGTDVEPAGESPENGRPALEATGGEVVMLSVVGLGALAAGTTLVMAGRRRKVAPTA